MSRTPEEMAEKWSVVVFDESELPEHERTKFSDWSIYKAMATMGFLAGYKAAQAIVEEELQAVQAQRVERPGLGSAEYALKNVLTNMGGK